MPRALSVSLCSPAWGCQFLSTTPLGVTLPITAPLTPPLQLDKVNTAITPNRPELPARSTVQLPKPEQALLCHCLPTPIRTFFCPGNLAPTPWGDQITLLKSAFKSFFCPSPLPQPNPINSFSTPFSLLPPPPSALGAPTPPYKTTLRERNGSLQEDSLQSLTSYHADCSLCWGMCCRHTELNEKMKKMCGRYQLAAGLGNLRQAVGMEGPRRMQFANMPTQ